MLREFFLLQYFSLFSHTCILETESSLVQNSFYNLLEKKLFFIFLNSGIISNKYNFHCIKWHFSLRNKILFFTLDRIRQNNVSIFLIWKNPPFPTLQNKTIKSVIYFSLSFLKTASRYAVGNGSENVLAVLFFLRQSKIILSNCPLILLKHHLRLQFYQEGCLFCHFSDRIN